METLSMQSHTSQEQPERMETTTTTTSTTASITRETSQDFACLPRMLPSAKEDADVVFLRPGVGTKCRFGITSTASVGFPVYRKSLCLSPTLQSAVRFASLQQQPSSEQAVVVDCSQSAPTTSTPTSVTWCCVSQTPGGLSCPATGGAAASSGAAAPDSLVVAESCSAKKLESEVDGGSTVMTVVPLASFDAKTVEALAEYLNSGKWNGSLLNEHADFLCLSAPGVCASLLPASFVDVYMTERWQRRMTIDRPVVNKQDFFKVMHTIPLRSDIGALQSTHLAIVSGMRDFVVNPELVKLQQKKDDLRKQQVLAGVDMRFVGVNLGKYKGKLVLAGGSMVSTVLGQAVRDYDFFFVGCTMEQAQAIVDDVIAQYMKGPRSPVRGGLTLGTKFVASSNAWSFGPLQFVFRGYKTVDEILLGFDIDCCCMAFDGSTMWISDRALHAFRNHCNVACLDRLSPSYEYRLCKYSERGFDVYVPGFDSHFVMPTPEGWQQHIFGAKLGQSGRKKRLMMMMEESSKPLYANLDHNTGQLVLFTGELVRPAYITRRWRRMMRRNMYQGRMPPAAHNGGDPRQPSPTILARVQGLDLLLFLDRFGRQRITISDYGITSTAESNTLSMGTVFPSTVNNNNTVAGQTQTNHGPTRTQYQSKSHRRKASRRRNFSIQAMLSDDSDADGSDNDNSTGSVKAGGAQEDGQRSPDLASVLSFSDNEEDSKTEASADHGKTSSKDVVMSDENGQSQRGNAALLASTATIVANLKRGWQKTMAPNGLAGFLNYKQGRVVSYQFSPNPEQACWRTMARIVAAAQVPLVWIDKNPGDQITSSFHAIVLTDHTQWYKGLFYDYVSQQRGLVDPRPSSCKEEEANEKITLHVDF